MKISRMAINGLFRQWPAALLCLCLLFLAGPQAGRGQDQPAPAGGEQPQQAPRNTSVQEDVNEFLGYEDLLMVRYLSLPYDTVMNTNMASYFVDVGFLLIIFLPLIYLAGGRTPWYHRLGFVTLGMAFLLIAAPSAMLNKYKLGVGSGSAYLDTASAAHPFAKEPLAHIALELRRPFVDLYPGIHRALSQVSGPSDRLTYPLLLLLLAAAIVLLDRRIQHHPPGSRIALHFFLVYSFLWLFLSSGIPWYGLLLFPLLLLFVVKGVSAQAGTGSVSLSVRKGLLITATAIWAIMAFAYRFSNYEPTDENRAKLPFMAAVSQYQIGQQDQDYVFDRIFPQYRTALYYINQEDQSYIYRVGTLMPFFISRNDRRVFSDNFLDFFQNLQANFPNPQELALALKAYGFRYIVVDLNLSLNDHTVEGTLKNKFQLLMNFLYQNPQLQLVSTDRIVRTADGTAQFQVFPEGNTVEHAGWFAVYHIL